MPEFTLLKLLCYESVSDCAKILSAYSRQSLVSPPNISAQLKTLLRDGIFGGYFLLLPLSLYVHVEFATLKYVSNVHFHFTFFSFFRRRCLNALYLNNFLVCFTSESPHNTREEGLPILMV